MGVNIECHATFAGDDRLEINDEIRDWIINLPDGATLDPVLRDFGSQRGPELRLVGLKASWSEVKQ